MITNELSSQMDMPLQTELLTEVDKPWWNSLVASVPEGTLFQTAHWADFLREYLKYDPQYLVVRDAQGEPVGLLLFFRTAYSHYTFFERPLDHWTIPCLKKLAPAYTWLQGPTALREEKREAVIQMALEAVERLAGREGAVMVSQMRLPLPAACALGARYQGQHAGSFGDAGCFSFHPRKSITTGERGA